jgi:cytochrome b
MKQITQKEIVWEWSIRVFHWIFAASISMALLISLLIDEDSPLFEWHMLAGLTAGFLLMLRLVLFLAGSRPINGRGLLEAFRGAPAFISSFLNKSDHAEAGHNFMAWLVYLLMFGLLAGTVLTGLNMHLEWAEDVHEVLAWSLLAMIVAHLAGLALHTLRYRENISLSMLTGRKRVTVNAGLKTSRPILGLVLLAISAAFITQLISNYQPGSGQLTLPWIQTSVALGEGHEESHQSEHHQEDRQGPHELHDD